MVKEGNRGAERSVTCVQQILEQNGHHFVPRAALGLCPGVRSSRGVGSESQFRDDALQRHAASRFEDRIAPGFEMLDVANFSLILPVRLVDQFLQALFTVDKALLP